MATQQEVLELAAKILDRLENEDEFKGAKIEDAVLLVELTLDEEGPVANDRTHERVQNPTVMLFEATTDRPTVNQGILSFALNVMTMSGFEEDE